MPVSITLSEDDLAAFGLLALAMDSLSIKLRQLCVNFSRVSTVTLFINYILSFLLPTCIFFNLTSLHQITFL